MDFAAIALFLVLYHLRVQEFLSIARSLRLVAFSMAFAIVATLMRERGFKLKDLVKTPHDWFMLAFLVCFGCPLCDHFAITVVRVVRALAGILVQEVERLRPDMEKISAKLRSLCKTPAKTARR